MLFFTYFTKIQGHRTEKILGVGTPSTRGAIPLKLFLDFQNHVDIVYFIDMFQSHVGPLNMIGVEFRSRGTSAATRSRDSDYAKCSCWSELSLHCTEINHIMYAEKTLYWLPIVLAWPLCFSNTSLYHYRNIMVW